MPHSQEDFYQVIRDVDKYQEFMPFMTNSQVIAGTESEKKLNGIQQGRFNANTTIGFRGLVDFTYMSKVSWKEPFYVLSIAGE